MSENPRHKFSFKISTSIIGREIRHDQSPVTEEHLKEKEVKSEGEEAFNRLKQAYGASSPYGAEFSAQLITFLIEKMNADTRDRTTWLKTLNLSVVNKGLFDSGGNARQAVMRLLDRTANYGAEDFIPLLKIAIDEFKNNSLIIPTQLVVDIDATCKWMNENFGLSL